MSYQVKEIFYTLQGEGVQAGRPAVFCRFSGCNLWNGDPAQLKSSLCWFCDTDFAGTDGENGGIYQGPGELADVIGSLWPGITGKGQPFTVLTGGEPALQVDEALLEGLRSRGFEIAVETNGTLTLPKGWDWVCVSPKSGTRLKVLQGNELKVVYPQDNLDPGEYKDLEFDHFLVQPRDGPDYRENLHKAVRYCLDNPGWRLSLQIHKIIGIP